MLSGRNVDVQVIRYWGRIQRGNPHNRGSDDNENEYFGSKLDENTQEQTNSDRKKQKTMHQQWGGITNGTM